MQTPDDMTLGEVVRTVKRIESGQNDMRAELSQKLDTRVTWEEVNRIEAGRDRQLKELELDIAAVRAAQSKVAWIIIAAVLTAVLALVVGVDVTPPR